MEKMLLRIRFAILLLVTVCVSCTFPYISFSQPIPISGPATLDIPGATYILANNIVSEGTCFNITADNITLDGAGYTITGLVSDPYTYGILAINVNGSAIKNICIEGFSVGIVFWGSNNITILDTKAINNRCYGLDCQSMDYSIIKNNMFNNNGYVGIWFYWGCDNNYLSENVVSNNGNIGIDVWGSSSNNITRNTVEWNPHGIYLSGASDNNRIYHNNFINNTHQATIDYMTTPLPICIWDNNYPSGGNYWSHYISIDLCSGPYQNETGSDGIGDTSYIIDANNIDNYPLMQPYHGPVRNLNTGHSYPTIQEAINNANDGDRIFVLSGTYYENAVINKTISLIGENRSATIIDGNGTFVTIIHITVNNVSIRGFTIQHNQPIHCLVGGGIYITDSNGTSVMGNVIRKNQKGINLQNSVGNTITGNIIIENDIGIQFLDESSNNTIYNNNFIDNSLQVSSEYSANVWDNGYPYGGNYWSDYSGVDLLSGPFQNETGPDGLGDVPHGINALNIDRYPLMSFWSQMTILNTNFTKIGKTYSIDVISNGTVLKFDETPSSIKLTMSGETGTSVYVRIIQQIGLNSTNIKIFLNNTKLNFPSIDPPRSISSNGSHYVIYFAFTFNSTYEVVMAFPIEGDINYDGIVDMTDIGWICWSYGASPSSVRWNPHCDLNEDRIIDMTDIGLACLNYGKQNP